MSNLKNRNNSRRKINNQSGQAVLIAVILSLAISMLILFGISLPVTDQVSNSNDYLSSKQSLINAEILNKESLYRLNKGKTLPSVLSLSIDNINSSAGISDLGLNDKQVVSQSIFGLFKNKTQSVLSSNRSISFDYGVWTSVGGVSLENNSEINGNVFSLGNIHTNNFSSINGAISTSSYYLNLPISSADIYNWKNQASSGLLQGGNWTISSDSTSTASALKIVGNLELKNGAVLELNGPLYVTGNLKMSDSSIIKLNSNYGLKSDTIVVDGLVNIESGSYISGSGQDKSNVILATENSNSSASVINFDNSSSNDVISVALNGSVYLNNNSSVKDVVSKSLILSNSSSINYPNHVLNVDFNSSTSTIWNMTSLKEIQ